MELVSGDNLESFLDQEKNFEVYYDILVQISSALAYIHNHKLVHRDIKPSNVLIDSAGQAKLMDFGLVKKLDASIQLTQADKFFGTMSYASPEQLLGEKIDYRSDLYSLGILIYRMFSSRLPFHADSMVGIITKHLSEVPTPLAELVPNCPVRLSDLCERLLMKSPLDRNLSAMEVADIIRNMSRGPSSYYQETDSCGGSGRSPIAVAFLGTRSRIESSDRIDRTRESFCCPTDLR